MIIAPVSQVVPCDRLPILEPMDLLRDRDNAGDGEVLAHAHFVVAIVDGRLLVGCSHNKNEHWYRVQGSQIELKPRLGKVLVNKIDRERDVTKTSGNFKSLQEASEM